MLEKFATENAYKAFAFAGLLVALVTPYLCWQYLSSLEEKAVSVFKQDILTRLDLESMQIQYQSLQNAIAISQNKINHPDAVDYTHSELEHLQAESQNISRQIETLAIDAGILGAAKKSIITNAKIVLSLSFIVMLIALLLAAFGLLGWYFHIRIYQERRSEFVEGRVSDK